MSAPNPGRCSIVVSVSRVLFSSSGGALVARFGEIRSLETEDACRVCPRLFVVAVACCCLLQLSCNLPVPMSAPNPGRFSIVVSVSRMHFSSSGGLFGKCGFRRTSCRIIVIICDRAVVCSRCSLLCSLFRDGSCAVPAPVISPHSSSLSIGLWVSWMFVLESWADIAPRGWVSTNFMPDHRHHMWPRCCLLSMLITLLVVL